MCTLRRCLSAKKILSTIILVIFELSSVEANAAEKINLGVIAYVTAGAAYIASTRGYFQEAGLDVSIKPFDSAQNVVVAVASRDLDFGTSSLTAGFFNLANKGAMKTIGGQAYEKKGYTGSVFVVSKKAWDAGFRTMNDFKGRSFGINQVGSSFHYMLARSLEAVSINVGDVEIRVLQTVANTVSAVRTGQVDAVNLAPVIAAPLLASGEVKKIGETSEFVEYQLGGIYANTPVLRDRPKTVEAFVRAYRRGVADYTQAFLSRDTNGVLVRTEETDAVARLISKAIYGSEDKAAEIIAAAAYISTEARLDVKDIERQVAWYKANKFIDTAVEAKNVIDDRFITPLSQ